MLAAVPTILRLVAPLLVLAALSACGGGARDSHVPDFAKRPFEPFSREAAVAIALREWRAFGELVVEPEAEVEDEEGDDAERVQGLWQRVGEYWWLGLDMGAPGQRYTGLHDETGRRFAPEQDGAYAWSAAFISYVMRMAGAGRRFPYSAAHYVYVNEAVRALAGGVLRAEDPALYPPQPGDLVCVARGPQADMRFANLPATRFWGHCDIAVAIEDEGLSVVGGNVQDAVALKQLPLEPDGRLQPLPDRPWLVVIRVLYDAP